MVKPRSNNLNIHVNWALSSKAYEPKYSLWDSPQLQMSQRDNRSNPVVASDGVVSCLQVNPTTNMNKLTTTADLRNNGLISDPIVVKQSCALPTSHSDDVLTISSESDSDLEYLASLPGVSKPKPTPSIQSKSEIPDLDISPTHEIVQIIDSSSGPSSPTGNFQALDTSLQKPPLFRLSQAQATDYPEPPKPELGFFFSEKIALLEQKVYIMSKKLSAHGIHCDTHDIDEKIRGIDHRIEQIPNDDDICDPFNLSSSPQKIQKSAGLPFEINNDQFDSDIYGSHVDFQSSKPNYAYNSDYRDNDEDDVDNIEILDHTENLVSKRDGINSPEDEDSLYHNRLDEPSLIMETQSVLPTQFPTQQITTQHMNTQKITINTKIYPWTKEMMQILRTKFGLQDFRTNQAEAVNETLSGNDIVVLMPTGGGKSLCYQLPALVTSGNTRGTTVVISPLISLMQDQVYHLKNRNINAEMVNSKLNASERSAVFTMLNNKELQLLYISPEMLSASAAMKSSLQRLYMDNYLARIVIDEAHCVSAWGHDFRPEYMELTKVKMEFPVTPIMALTATANERVLLDIVGCLRPNPIVLKQSFNRPNLFYEVRPKTSNVITEMAAVCKTYGNKSGIIYCHSKRNCEETATKLSKMGILAKYYHAGMDQEDRAEVQQSWQQGICTVVCATIAFGMGIDKPDVRYVMHMTIPRNIEGYYQETGRAGRDGKFSQCILFYNYKDVQLLQKMISQDTQLSFQVREHHRTLLIRVMQYCENKTDCRRQHVLQYFNEEFDPKLCHQQCDNCRSMKYQGIIRKDMSSEAKLVVSVVTQVAGQHVTLQQINSALMGWNTQKSKSCGFDKMPWFGSLSSFGILMVERLLHALVSERVIEEYSQYNHSRFPQSYIKLGPNAIAVASGQMPIELTMPRDSEKVSSQTGNTSPHFAGKATSQRKRSSKSTTTRGSKKTRYAFSKRPRTTIN